ncbi:MAG: FAD-binding protein [Firmicutes bacterium]|nr:FAD-binding protein [Bacillota bacterium]
MPTYQLAGTLDRSQWTARYPRLGEEQRAALWRALRQELGHRAVIADRDQLLAYSYDATGERHWPDVVVLPDSKEQVAAALRIAQRFRVPIIGRGAGSNLSGGTTPIVGGMVVSFTRMNRILEVNTNDRYVRVEPGVVNADLDQALKPLGFFYPPDPSSHRISTIGGNVAENSGGPHCVKYGVTTHHVLALTIALADGTLLQLPRTGDTSQGLDLASVVIGSEGTLALVVEATLAIHPRPVAKETLLMTFASVEAATRAVSALIAARLNPAALELMDRESLVVVEAFVHAGYPVEAGAVLLIELDGMPEELARDTGRVEAIVRREGALSFKKAESEAEAEAFWRGRRAHYGATARLAPHLWVQDVTVPRPRLHEMMNRVLKIAAQYEMRILTAAHAGDGNLHPNMPYDPQNADEVRRLKMADRAIMEACVELGGSITGEHGVGIDKADNLPLMYSADELQAMNEVKASFDPAGLLNPLKALWPADNPPPPSVNAMPRWQPESVEEVAEALRWAYDHQTAVRFKGEGRRQGNPVGTVMELKGLKAVHELDVENLSLDVGAGAHAGSIARLLAQEGLDVPGLEPFMDDTVGGLVSANAPYWRSSLGRGWRDVVLAVEWVDGRGRRLAFGRKTMKNVAGYDVAKLMVGARGRLGAVVRLTLRLRPAPEHATLAVSEPMSTERAVEALRRLLAHPARPEGILAVKPRGSSGRLTLCCVDDLRRGWQRAALADAVRADFEFREGRDAWLAFEKDRYHQISEAVQAGLYGTGAAPWGEEAQRQWLAGLPHDAACYWMPGTGIYEIVGASTPQAALPSEFRALEDRVARVFDPRGILREEGQPWT